MHCFLLQSRLVSRPISSRLIQQAPPPYHHLPITTFNTHDRRVGSIGQVSWYFVAPLLYFTPKSTMMKKTSRGFLHWTTHEFVSGMRTIWLSTSFDNVRYVLGLSLGLQRFEGFDADGFVNERLVRGI